MQIKNLLITILLSTTLFFANNVLAQELEGPSIELKTSTYTVEAGKTLKVNVIFSEPILKFTRDFVSINGGSVESVRKLSSYTYLLFVRAEDDVKELDIQIEASKVQNFNKVYNTYSSNNLIIRVKQPKAAKVSTPVPSPDTTLEISKLLDSVVQKVKDNPAPAATVQPTQNTSPVQQVQPIQPISYYNCKGYYIPTTSYCNSQYSPVSPYYKSNYYYPRNNYGYGSVYYEDEEDEDYYTEEVYVVPNRKNTWTNIFGR